jgi:acetoin utilization protein AcuB
MLRVRDSMTRDVVTLGPEASAAEAWALLGEHDIRHVPVVEGGRLVGLVSDRDLRDVRGGGEDRESETPRWVRLGDMMTGSVVTIHPLDTIEHAAREIYDRKIGCLPVVADGELVGIITSADMMRTLIELVGAHGRGTWVEVEVPNEPGTLSGVTDVIQDRKVNIAGIFLGPADRETNRVVVLRLETENATGTVRALENGGYRVTTVESSPIAASGPYEE